MFFFFFFKENLNQVVFIHVFPCLSECANSHTNATFMPPLTFVNVALQCLPLLAISCIYFGEPTTTKSFYTTSTTPQEKKKKVVIFVYLIFFFFFAL